MRPRKTMRYAFYFCLILAGECAAMAQTASPYNFYVERERRVSEIDWRLVQVNLKIGNMGHFYFITFDSSDQIFTTKRVIDTQTLLAVSPANLRESLFAEVGLIKAAIGSEFPEFKRRESSDLRITLLIGEYESRQFASYKNGKFAFSDNYVAFLREHGRSYER